MIGRIYYQPLFRKGAHVFREKRRPTGQTSKKRPYPVRIIGQRSLRSQCIKGTSESLYRVIG